MANLYNLFNDLILFLADILSIFPYYSDLDSIWHEIPPFDNELLSSQHNIQYAELFLAFVQKRSAKDPSKERADLYNQNEAGLEGTIVIDAAKMDDTMMGDLNDNSFSMIEENEEEGVFNDTNFVAMHQDSVTHAGIDTLEVSQVFLSH